MIIPLRQTLTYRAENNHSMINALIGQDRETQFRTLYVNVFPHVARYVSKMGGTLEEAQDIFQESLVYYYERILTQNIAIHTTEENYLMGITRNIWSRRFKESIKFKSLDELNTLPGKSQNKSLLQSKLMAWLEVSGKKCLNLLKAIYYDKQPLQEIAAKHNFSGSHSVSVQKYKCIEKIRTKLKEKTIDYEDFFE